MRSETSSPAFLRLSWTNRMTSRAWQAREVIRFVQDSRKKAGLDVSDRITLAWSASADLAKAIEEHAEQISQEVLAVQMSREPRADDWAIEPDLGLAVKV